MDFNTGSGGGSGAGGSSGGAGEPPPPRVAAGGTEFELSDPVASFIRTVRELVSRPTAFFRGMPKSGNLINPIAFAAICAAIAALPAALLFLVFFVFAGAAGGDASSALGGAFGGIIFAIFLVILFPIGAVVGTFVSAAIYHLLTLLWARRGHAGFGATLRVVSYAAFPIITSFLAFIPILNFVWAFAVSIYTLVLLILGIREAHATTTGTSLLVVFTLPAIGLVLGIVSSILGAIAAVSLGQ